MQSIHSAAILATVARLLAQHEDIIITQFDDGTANVVAGDEVINFGCHWEDGADGDLVLVLDAA